MNKRSFLKTTALITLVFLQVATSLASEGNLVSRVVEREGRSFYDLAHYDYPDKQVVLFFGSFGDAPFKPARDFIKGLKKGKDVHLYIGRGMGGSVSQHKRFIKEIKKLCTKRFSKEKTCEVVTYLDGQCSSMCITLFLSGDKRYARDDRFANLGFHRTVFEFNGRHIPIQSVNSMVRYFSEFSGVNKDYLKQNKNIIFGQQNNGLYQAYGQELLDAGFAHELTEKLDGSQGTFLKNF